MQETVTGVLALCGGISVVGGAWAVIAKWIAPAMKLGANVREHDKMLEGINEKLRMDYERLLDSERADRLICRALVDITGHMIYGNHVDEMKKTQKALLDFLTK